MLAHQQTSFITSAAPGAPDAETDNVPYLSGESRVREAGSDGARVSDKESEAL